VSNRILPAEWYPQDGILLTWPHADSDWAPWLSQIDKLYCQIVKTISLYEKVLLVCFDDQHQTHIAKLLKESDVALSKILFKIISSNDSWARDHGPITVIEDHQPTLLDFAFTGWGGKYRSERDNLISQRLFTQNTFNRIDIEAQPLILEGGSIDCDGQGTLLTTEDCLLNPNRNTDLTKSDYENYFRQHFGVQRVLWLSQGELVGDDTDSHIDMLARFCDSKTIAYTACDDKKDIHFEPLSFMEKELQSFRTLTNQPYKLVALPIPAPIHNDQGERLPASYANFLIINGAVLVPVYGDKNDQIAVERLAECFPDRKIIPINCRSLIEQFGSLHCISMQLPAGTLKR